MAEHSSTNTKAHSKYDKAAQHSSPNKLEESGEEFTNANEDHVEWKISREVKSSQVITQISLTKTSKKKERQPSLSATHASPHHAHSTPYAYAHNPTYQPYANYSNLSYNYNRSMNCNYGQYYPQPSNFAYMPPPVPNTFQPYFTPSYSMNCEQPPPMMHSYQPESQPFF